MSPVFCPHTNLLTGGLTPFGEESNQAALCQPSPPLEYPAFWCSATKWLFSWTGRYPTETTADSFNVIFAWTWAVHMGFVAENMARWQGFLWTLQFSPDVRCSNKVPWTMYRLPSGVGWGDHNSKMVVVTVWSMVWSLRLTQMCDVPGVDD